MRLEHRITPTDVRAVSDALCADILPMWMVARAARSNGKPIPDEVEAAVQRVANRCNALCAADPIPLDFREQLETARHG